MYSLTTDSKNNLIIGKGKSYVYVIDNTLTQIAKVQCSMHNINQIQLIGENLLIKNTNGQLSMCDKVGKEIWKIKLGSNFCTDGTFCYDESSNNIYLFFYSFNQHEKMWLCKIDAQSGAYETQEFLQKIDNCYHTYHKPHFRNGILHYYRTCLTDGRLTHTELVTNGNCVEKYNYFGTIEYQPDANTNCLYSGVYNFATDTFTSFYELDLGGVLYNIVRVGDRFYCEFCFDKLNNRITVTDLQFNKLTTLAIKYSAFTQIDGKLVIAHGNKLKFVKTDI